MSTFDWALLVALWAVWLGGLGESRKVRKLARVVAKLGRELAELRDGQGDPPSGGE